MANLISFDWAIKRLLRNKANFSILEGFLSELLAPDKDLKIVNILESESNQETGDDKFNRVDILVALEPGDIALIEVQITHQLDFLHRMLYGTSKIITEYLASGDPYALVKKIYSVNIVYFDLGHGADYIYKGTTDFVGMHNNDHLQLSKKQKDTYKKEFISEIYPEYYIIKINNFDDLAKNTLDEWIYFLKNEEIKPDFTAKGLLQAKQEFDVMNLSKEELVTYKKYQDNLHYQASMVESSYGEGKYDGVKVGIEQGKAEGLEQGRNEREKQIAINLLKNNIAIETIAIATGLSTETINELVKLRS